MITHNPIQEETTHELELMIERLQDGGGISQKDAFNMNAELFLAMHRIRHGHPETAAYVLEALVEQVEVLVRSHQVEPENGMAMIRKIMRLMVD